MYPLLTKLTATLCTLVLSGCLSATENNGVNATQQAEHPALAWLENADPRRDAQQAMESGDLRLWVLATRGAAMPGIPTAQRQPLTAKCGEKYLPGSTDALRGEQHLKLLQQAQRYAVIYNQVMAQHCAP